MFGGNNSLPSRQQTAFAGHTLTGGIYCPCPGNPCEYSGLTRQEDSDISVTADDQGSDDNSVSVALVLTLALFMFMRLR
jgi:hypothetical protein